MSPAWQPPLGATYPDDPPPPVIQGYEDDEPVIASSGFPDDEDDRPVIPTCDPDGTHHFSQLKNIADSGMEYLQAVSVPIKPSAAMRLGTIVHQLILGPRHGSELVIFDGKTRAGKAWDLFYEAHGKSREIVTVAEWERGREIAAAVIKHPAAQRRLQGSRFEVPLKWEDNGILCSTSGVDILTAFDGAGDLKTTTSVKPEKVKKHAHDMAYHCQLVWYRRACRANGIPLLGDLFALCAQVRPPFDVVDLVMDDDRIELAEKTVSLWLERLRVLRASCPRPRHVSDWPGYAQSPVIWGVDAWMRDDEESEDEEDEEASA